MKLSTIAIIFISIVIIVSSAYFKSLKEGLTNKNTIILMGDSVLNNSKFVPAGKTVYDFLKQKVSNVVNVAKDGATISDLYSQLDQIPIELNSDNTFVFISIGGNNILKSNPIQTNKLFNEFTAFLDALRAKLNNVRINILNLYLPSNPQFEVYAPIVNRWNQLIQQSSTKVGAMYSVIDIHALLTNPSDFVYDIEPSETASEKIAYLIYLSR